MVLRRAVAALAALAQLARPPLAGGSGVGPVQAQAVFSMDGVQGSIVFEQDPGEANSRVTVSLHGLKDGPNPWHIHESALTDALPHDCAKAGGHFEASEPGKSRWDMGTLKAQPNKPHTEDGVKHNANVSLAGQHRSVSLSGPHSIVGRSVVIHKAKVGASPTAARWVCANIRYVDPPVAAWAVFDMNGVKGLIQFEQATNGSAPTQITVDLTGIGAGQHPWHVHQKPGDGKSCGEPSTGGHFGDASVWDLGAKHGMLTGAAVNSHFAEATWAGLPLFGPGTIVGHSIVIHKPNSDRWVCAEISARPTCHDDPSWKDDGGCAAIHAGGALACLDANSHDRMANCKRTCGYCADQVGNTANPFALKPGVLPRPSLIKAGSDNWFHFSADAGKSYQVVATVVPGASNLQDSVLELYTDANRQTYIEMNDDAPTGGDASKATRGDRGSKISWACTTAGVYWVRVRGFNPQDHGYYTVHLATVDHADSCNDGKQGVGEEGVDCGGDNCQPCHISIILGFKQSQTTAGDLTWVDDDNNGVPDFFQNLERDVKSALHNATTHDIWTRVEVKDVQTTPHGLNVNMFLEAPPDFPFSWMDPNQIVNDLRTEIMTPTSHFKERQPDLQSVSRGELCPPANVLEVSYLCGFGTCSKTVGAPQRCACDSVHTGSHCHQTIPGPSPPVDEKRWLYPTVVCAVLVLVVLACWQRNRVQKRAYNQSVFEMLQAPETFAGPDAGFVKTTPGGLLRTASQGPPSGGSGGLAQQLTYDTSKAYTPNQSYVTGGF